MGMMSQLLGGGGGCDPGMGGGPMPSIPPAMAGIVQGPGMDDLSVPSPVMGAQPGLQGAPPGMGGPPSPGGPPPDVPPDMMGGSESGPPGIPSISDRMTGKMSQPAPSKAGRGKK